ncbi:hypothetical protein DPMN_156288 [Dreissena polymorpha]|uniref:Uncharacterized protein n=1 Tax=Dreissena polymorpha TaxID=45954 RepID=A0A9D4J8N7_DREPO|nr:hypothetical protein DPMN_156288 [Dreissena polymorpha]
MEFLHYPEEVTLLYIEKYSAADVSVVFLDDLHQVLVSMTLCRMFRAENLPRICALNTSAFSGSLSFSKSDLIRNLRR